MKAKSAFNGKIPDQSRLLHLLNYDLATGIFTRKVSVSGNAKAGDRCEGVHVSGYIYIGVDGRDYKAHRLAWLYVTGEWPSWQIDHADGDRSNNAWTNLRSATPKQNCANAAVRKDNKTGFKGVRAMGERWQVRIGNGGRIHVGTFDTLEEAKAAYEVASQREYGQFARQS